MEKAELVRRWLAGWDAYFTWLVDCLGKKSGSAAVFPQGSRVVSRREDILGGERVRVADTYALKLRVAASGETDGAPGAQALESLAAYTGCPVFGENQHASMEKGRLSTADGSTAVYQLTLTVEYDK